METLINTHAAGFAQGSTGCHGQAACTHAPTTAGLPVTWWAPRGPAPALPRPATPHPAPASGYGVPRTPTPPPSPPSRTPQQRGRRGPAGSHGRLGPRRAWPPAHLRWVSTCGRWGRRGPQASVGGDFPVWLRSPTPAGRRGPRPPTCTRPLTLWPGLSQLSCVSAPRWGRSLGLPPVRAGGLPSALGWGQRLWGSWCGLLGCRAESSLEEPH